MKLERSLAADWTHRHTTAGKWYPSETLVRLFRGYIPPPPDGWQGKRVLDVGCGNGNNLGLFDRLGCDAYGTEIAPELCGGRVKRGANRSIPWPNEFFDVVVSWNVLHYEMTWGAVIAALAEYARVLKPGGLLALSTTGPDHKILDGCEWMTTNRVRLHVPGDFRDGDIHYVFRGPADVHRHLSQFFDGLRVGRERVELYGSVLDWWIVTGTKGG